MFFQNQITSLPIEVFFLYPKLRTVDVAENQISTLTIEDSASLEDKKNAEPARNRIQELNLSSNQLTGTGYLFSSLFTYFLPNLNSLDLSMNRLHAIPKSIGQLVNLEHLNVSLNQIREIPDELRCLDNLKRFRASFNLITSLPAFFEEKFAPAMQELALLGNRLSVLPSFASYTSLIYLSLTTPCMTSRPLIPSSLKRLYLSFSGVNTSQQQQSISPTPHYSPAGLVEPVKPFSPSNSSPSSSSSAATAATSGASEMSSMKRGKSRGGASDFRPPSHKLADLSVLECIGEEEKFAHKFKKFNISFSHMMGSMGKDEDRVVLDFAADAEFGIVGILDGHGGSAVVRYLSEFLAPTIRRFLALREFANNVHGALSAAFAACNHAVYSYGQQHFDQSELESGCTAVVVLISDTRIITANVGDSRAVFYPHLHKIEGDRSAEALQLSLDHKPSLPAEVNRIQMQGGIVVGDLMSKGYRISHPRSGSHSGAIAITRSFGDFGLSPLISSEPYISEIAIPDHDDWTLVLASDGVFDVISESVLQIFHDRVIRDYPGLYSAQFMATMIREMSYLFNSRDDISVCYLYPTPNP